MIVDALVEIPKGSRNKFEFDEASGRMRLIVTYDPTFPGCLVPVRPVGVLDMRDEKGRDQKILAVPDGDPRFREVADLEHLAPHFLAEIKHFFAVYKTLEEKATDIVGWSGAVAAEQTVRDAQRRYRTSLTG